MSYKAVKLGDVIDVVMGQAPPGETCNKDGIGTPFVKAGEFRAFSPVLKEWTTEPKKMGAKGDVFLCVVGATCGKINLGADCAIGRSVAALRPKEDALLQTYLYYFMSQQVMRLRNGSQGAAQTVISKDMINGISLTLPPLSEQKRIAAILDKADAIRKKRQQAIELADQFLRSVFLDMFGDPVTNPKGWDVEPLSSLVETLEGGKNIKPDESGRRTLRRILKVSAVTSGVFKPQESKPLPDNWQPPESYFVREGDLLFSRANTSELIGATALVPSIPDNLVLPDKLWRFKWRDRLATSPSYVNQLLQHSEMRREIRVRASGTSGSMKNISKPKLMEIPIPIPPASSQREFEAIASTVRASKMEIQKSAAGLDRLFESLSGQAFLCETGIN